MPLADDPNLMRRPLGFAVRISRADNLDVDAARQRLPGLLQFARTFVAEVLEKEFDTPLAGFPASARVRAATLTARLRREDPTALAARLLVMSVVDLCDFEIDREATSGDEADEYAYVEQILDVIQRLLHRFADWIDASRLPRLGAEADRARREFAAASAKLRS